MGYVMDRRVGDTDGLGGAFGLLHAIGVPFPFPGTVGVKCCIPLFITY